MGSLWLYVVLLAIVCAMITYKELCATIFDITIDIIRGKNEFDRTNRRSRATLDR